MLALYVDSADCALAEPLLWSGCFSGLTTNPTLLQAAGLRRQDLSGTGRLGSRGWCQDTVFLQPWGATVDELGSHHGRELRRLGDPVVIKVPVTQSGVQAAATLESEGTPVLVTAVYNSGQALAAVAAGASFIAPYLGRMSDAGRNGLQEIAGMQQAIAAVGSATRILVASLREPSNALGVRDLTMAPAVWSKFFTDPLTDAAVQVFEQAVPLARALVRGGVGVIEITLRTAAGLSAIERVAAEVPEIVVGAGTVTTPAEAAEVSLRP